MELHVQTTSTTLLTRLRNSSDSAAWREFDERYRELLMRFCITRSVPRLDAEDVVQHVLTGLVKTLPKFVYDRSRGRFRDYLFRCVRNSISQWAARTNGRPAPLDTDSAENLPTAGTDAAEIDAWEQEWVAHHYRLAMRTVEQTFDPRSVEVFNRSIAGATVADLAREFDLSEPAVHQLRRRLRDRMQELVAEQIRQEDEVK